MNHKVTLLKIQSHFLLLFALVAMVSLGACKSSNNSQQTAIKPAGTQAVTPDGNERAKAYLENVGKRIRIAIANGDISEEAGAERYNAAAERMRQRMTASKRTNAADDGIGESREREVSDADKRARRARYQEASDNMLKMVESGEITREQMQTRLDGMRRRMGESSDGGTSDADKRARYQEASDNMLKMVESGEITREQMEARLNRMKKAMSGGKDTKVVKEISDDCIALRKKLGEGVRSGEMTRKEAGKIWEEEGC